MSSVPRATYRLQLSRDFTFADASGLVDYLADLGVSHLYTSPFLKARPGSTHGYDIIDHNQINPEVGSIEELRALTERLRSRGMGIVLDFVPNHMGVGGEDNAWWLDVLEWGRLSPYAEFFDIDWHPSRPDLAGKVLLPVLGDHYGAILEKGEISLRFDPAEGSFSAWYFDHRFPITPDCYAAILRGAPLREGKVEEDVKRLLDPPSRREAAGNKPQRAAHPHAEGMKLKAQLAELATRTPESAAALERAAESFNGTSGDAVSWRRLHDLLEAQHYRIAYWRVAADEINYRRFFNINDLAGIRIELPELFERAHRLVLTLVAEGRLSGLRIDHIDGLFDPAGYCERLQREASSAAQIPPGAFYVVVEKILASHETLRGWPVAGTTGYDFIREAGGLFIDPAGERPLLRTYRRVTGRSESYDAVLYAGKRRVTEVTLASETNVLAGEFHALAHGHWRTRDFTLNGMRAALDEVIAAFPIYRTYVSALGAEADDRRYIDWAIALSKKRWPGADSSIFDFIAGVLTLDLAESGGYDRAEVLRLAMRFQQVTGPVMAKGAEDTAFYRHGPLLALNEVGGDPRRFGHSVAAFHRLAELRAQRWPLAMLASSTHDTKRGEDARARLALLSELPREWRRRVALWSRLNRLRRGEVDGEVAPDPKDEYFFYQTVLGAWPLDLASDDEPGLAAFSERVQGTMTKAVREAKERSSWSNPNGEYEAVVARFVAGALDGSRPNPFLQDMHGLVESLARPGAINSLAQTLIKLAAPGIPDTYQGGELWDFSMVDPDNRRPVAWAARRRLLDGLRERFGTRPVDHQGFTEMAAQWRDGREKLFLIWRALAFRAEQPALFAGGAYLPLETSGRHADHLCAFARIADGHKAVAVAPRLVASLLRDGGTIDWADTVISLPEGATWRDVLAERNLGAREGAIAAAELLADFPVALLASEG